jgi:fumarate reductase subunit D
MKEFRLGVLFVHGIGTQPPRDTLVRWGDVLIKVIGRATEEEPGRTIPIVGQADAGDRSGDKPAEVAVEFRCSDRDQREKWLLAEGWWADSFPAPTYSELVSWSFRALPWAIALHIAQRFWQTNPKASKGAWLWALAKAGTQLLFAMAFAPVLMILLALTLVLGLLPIPQLRSLILTTQTTVVGSVGDSLAFVESPLRAALIRGRILEGLERLKVRCERTVIVAHSQGAAATLDALGGILDHDETGESPAPPPEGPVPDALVTFGSGVNQLVSLKVLSAGRLERNIGTNAASVAVIATLGMIALLVFLFVSIQSERTNIGQLVKALTFLSVLWGGGALVFWGSNQMLNNLTAWEVLGARQEAADKKLKLWASMVIYIAFSAARPLPLQRPPRPHNHPPRVSCYHAGQLRVFAVGDPVAHHTNCGDETRATPPGPVQMDRCVCIGRSGAERTHEDRTDVRGSDVRASLESRRAPVRPYDLLG